jgi:hypothetical protein
MNILKKVKNRRICFYFKTSAKIVNIKQAYQPDFNVSIMMDMTEQKSFWRVDKGKTQAEEARIQNNDFIKYESRNPNPNVSNNRVSKVVTKQIWRKSKRNT